MKDKNLPNNFEKKSLEELTEQANNIIQTLEKEEDLGEGKDQDGDGMYDRAATDDGEQIRDDESDMSSASARLASIAHSDATSGSEKRQPRNAVTPA